MIASCSKSIPRPLTALALTLVGATLACGGAAADEAANDAQPELDTRQLALHDGHLPNNVPFLNAAGTAASTHIAVATIGAPPTLSKIRNGVRPIHDGHRSPATRNAAYSRQNPPASHTFTRPEYSITRRTAHHDSGRSPMNSDWFSRSELIGR